MGFESPTVNNYLIPSIFTHDTTRSASTTTRSIKEVIGSILGPKLSYNNPKALQVISTAAM